MCVWPWRARMREMIAGRSMPSIVFSTKRPVAISAPVLPALTQASASPAFTRSIATRIEESFFLRSASCGFSSMETTCVASLHGDAIAAMRAAPSRSSARSARRRPTSTMRRSDSRSSASSAAGTVTPGP